MRHLVLFVLMMSGTSACMPSEPQVRLGDRSFTVELATTGKEQELGLMFRDSLPEDHGMLFIFPSAVTRSFWMKNTRIPLDILYFDAELRLVSVVENARPCRVQNCPTYPSAGPAQYVLELNAGKARELGVGAGDRLELDVD